MKTFIIRRLLYMIPTLLAVSIVAFAIIQLPPGDYLTTLMADWASQGGAVEAGTLDALRDRFGLDQPMYMQYWKWISSIVTQGDFGVSFEHNKPVSEIIWGRLGYTFLISCLTLLFIWTMAIPIGIYSAVKQYSLGDYVVTFLGFIGLAIPSFLLALLLMYLTVVVLGYSVGGLFSMEFADAPWSVAKFLDFLAHVWMPILVVGMAGLASLIRVLRANLLDELHKPYVVTARAKGLPEWRLILKYPVRIALNPLISTIGWVLPALVSGEIIVSVVLSLPTSGPILLRSLMAQDMYLAGSIILMVSTMTIIGTLISDILLALVDPRIRYQ